MKLSDKLLILVVLAAFVIGGSAHLNLYSRYKKGKAVVSGMPAKKILPTPVHLSLSGFLDVTLIHSDTFFIEYSKPEVYSTKEGEPHRTLERGDVIPRYKGDTMILSGLDTFHTSGANGPVEMAMTPKIYIHCPNISTISVDANVLSLTGDPDTAHAFSAHLVLRNVQLAQVWGHPLITNEFNRLSFECNNSHVVLQNDTHVRQLQMQLDKTSSAVLLAHIDQLSMKYDDESHFEMYGAAIRHLFQSKPDTTRHK